MPDVEELLAGDGGETGLAAGAAAVVPPFDRIARRGRRRQRVTQGLVAGAVVVAVVAVAGIGRVVTGHDAAPPEPAPSPSPTASTVDSTVGHATDPAADPSAIIEDPHALLRSLAVDAHDSANVASLWQCRRECDNARGSAVAVSGDGFATRHVLSAAGATSVTSLGEGAFLLRPNRGLGEVVYSNGRKVPVREGPVGPGSTPSFVWERSDSWLYLFDPHTATAERLGVEGPGEALRLPDGRLVAQTGGSVQVSDDDGATWQALAQDPTTPSHQLFWLVPAATSDVVMVEGGDGATLFPFEAVHRADGGRMVRIAEDTDPMRYLGGQAVLPDGRLLIFVAAWSDERSPTGFYVSDEDWTSFTHLPGPPGTDGQFGSGDPIDIAVTSTTATIIARGDVQDSDGPPVYVSTDAGETWQPFPAR